MSFWGTFIDQGASNDSLLESIRYQLTSLLNSEAPMRALPEGFDEVKSSNFSFGLDSAHSISSQINHDQFSRSLEKWIKTFEPRLTDVSVFIEESNPSKNIMSFSLMAKVDTGDGSHVFLFDSNISLSNQVARMEGQEVV
ncbi:type VI secretion system baseplate subunit TssE [Marinomonas mediterranea]|uniref:GPW/gp25 family protein n=1 Tax=Marinomonas mediterranea (strain ATCC 700492 / JCM 21426 / NBRC 103028 / MMB-1) TaxID=717774 RepID=F2K2L4_MARM1|nr:type VI secretion system baseplate subunit TssE [Marinomonas mediterranea]ADZ90059.1 GPW/gp25 family protein [Marinomonas mediterranea MMB-1]WCN16266.1 type VI secretion system baseplate subunit TssE [Marinomonas mediterranea MMB-1]